jgi:AcrR family transcriptional regulator
MRNVEHTKQRILEAATQEFSEHGFAGARVDRIANNACANKALIYTYFGNKEKLFEAVYREIMGQVVRDVPMDPSDLPGYLARRLDWQFHNPVLSRIVTWGALELDGFPETAGSRDIRARKIELIARAQRDGAIGTGFQPEQVLQLIDTLARPWPPRGAIEPERQAEFEQYKQTAVSALRRLLTGDAS